MMLLLRLSRHVRKFCTLEFYSPHTFQPHPDPALLTTERSPSSNVIDDTSKVNVISRDEDPSTCASDVYIPEDTKSEFISTNRTDSERKGKGSRHLQEARAEGSYLWDVTRHYLLRPGAAGGLVGLGMVDCFQDPMWVDDFFK